MHVHFTYVLRKNYINSSAVYSIVSCGFFLKFQLILAFTHMLVIHKNEEDTIKTKGPRVATIFSHHMRMGTFSVAQGWLTLLFVF